MPETLQEYFSSRGVQMRVDREASMIRGVKVLGLESRNGRVYSAAALEAAAPLYEGAKVNVNHPRGNPAAPRDYQDRLGVVRNVQWRDGEGLFGDLHFNPKHALAEQLAWDAEHAAENVGFSHNVQARVTRQHDRATVEAIIKVNSVDLVADPATTHGLFEHNADTMSSATPQVSLQEATGEQLATLRPDLVANLREQVEGELRAARGELDRLRGVEAVATKRQQIQRLLSEHALPSLDATDRWSRSIVSEAFVAALFDAKSEAALRQLIEDRTRLIESVRGASDQPRLARHAPLSREQAMFGERDLEPMDTAAFVRAIAIKN